jgi:DNA-directed RNA polymerase specialized sigma24 family protein
MEPLARRLSAGEPAAFAELYELCAVRCHHYLVARLGARDAADDVLQDVFVRLVRQVVKRTDGQWLIYGLGTNLKDDGGQLKNLEDVGLGKP